MPSSPNFVEFHGYHVYADGRVYRPEMIRTRRDGVSRRIKAGWQATRTRRAPVGRGGGYVSVDLWVAGQVQHWLMHRLVATCFVPNPEGKRQVNHKDGVRSNNAASNLEWVTPSENQTHAYRSGVRRYNGCTAEMAVRIWTERNIHRRTLADVAAEFGVSFQTVSRIAKGGHHAVIP